MFTTYLSEREILADIHLEYVDRFGLQALKPRAWLRSEVNYFLVVMCVCSCVCVDIYYKVLFKTISPKH